MAKRNRTLFNIDCMKYEMLGTDILFVDFGKVFDTFKWAKTPVSVENVSTIDQLLYQAVIERNTFGGTCNCELNVCVIDSKLPRISRVFAAYHELGHLVNRNEDFYNDEMLANVNALCLMRNDGMVSGKNINGFVRALVGSFGKVRSRYNKIRRVDSAETQTKEEMCKEFFALWNYVETVKKGCVVSNMDGLSLFLEGVAK